MTFKGPEPEPSTDSDDQDLPADELAKRDGHRTGEAQAEENRRNDPPA